MRAFSNLIKGAIAKEDGGYGDEAKFLVGWVRSTELGLLPANPVSLPDHVWIAKHLNPTPDLSPGKYIAWTRRKKNVTY